MQSGSYGTASLCSTWTEQGYKSFLSEHSNSVIASDIQLELLQLKELNEVSKTMDIEELSKLLDGWREEKYWTVIKREGYIFKTFIESLPWYIENEDKLLQYGLALLSKKHVNNSRRKKMQLRNFFSGSSPWFDKVNEIYEIELSFCKGTLFTHEVEIPNYPFPNIYSKFPRERMEHCVTRWK